jgi:hypothetical protein
MKGGTGAKIGIAILCIIGLVIFYSVKGAVNTEGWDDTVVALLALIPLALIVWVILDVFGISWGGKH